MYRYVYTYTPTDLIPTDILIRMQSHILYTAEVTAFHSGSVSHHCRSRPVLLALLPAWADTQVVNRQDAITYVVGSLRTICLVGVSHRHDVQNMLCSNVLQHPAPKGDRGLDTPSRRKAVSNKRCLSRQLKRTFTAVLLRFSTLW